MRFEFTAGELTLRPFGTGDEPVLRHAGSAPEMDRQFPFPILDDADAGRLIERWSDRAEDDSGYVFALVERDLVVGQVCVGVDRSNDQGWISYWTVPSARGRGVAGRGCTALAQWCFQDAGLFRLELGHRVNNPASRRVALAAGFRVEGVQREKLRYGVLRFDVELHARLVTD